MSENAKKLILPESSVPTKAVAEALSARSSVETISVAEGSRVHIEVSGAAKILIVRL